MNKPKARKHNIVIQKIEDETLVYDLDENKAYCLNETSALVWGLCDGTRDASDISNEMSTKLKTLINEEFVHLALDQLSKDGLLNDSGQDYFSGLSRREIISKIGFSTAVALPLVAAIVAPEIVDAASCLPNPTAVTCDTTDPNCTPLGSFSQCPASSCCSGCCVAPTGNPGSGNCANGTCP